MKTRNFRKTRKILVTAAALLLVTAVVAVILVCRREKETIVEGVPDYVVDYAASFDGLYRASVTEQHPDVQKRFNSPEVQEAFLKWLATDAAWKPENVHVTWGALRAIYPRRCAQDAKVVRPFLKHENNRVRHQAYSVLVLHAFGKPEKREELFALLRQMLQDSSPFVRKQGLELVRSSKAGEDLRPDLEALKNRMEKLTPKTWRDSAVCEMLEQMIEKPER